MSCGRLVASAQRLLTLDGVGYRGTGQNCERMADVGLTPMDLKLLPPIAHASAEGDPAPHPETLKAVINLDHLIRPEHGLWCSPVTAWSAEGAPTATAWTEWCATPDELTRLPSGLSDRYTKLTQVEPLPQARIYLIDATDDLNLLVEAFPLPPSHRMHRSAPDRAAMAASSWDAVYASAAGIAANAERTPMFEPSLARWECPSLGLSPGISGSCQCK